MRSSIFMITLALCVLTAMFLTGCPGTEVNDNDRERDEPEEIEYELITDPDAVVLAINDMPVTKAEFDEAVEKIKPEPFIGIYRAFTMHYLPMVGVKNEYKEEIEELKEEMSEIYESIKAGEITFDDAIMQYSEDPGKDINEGLMENYSPGSMYYTLDETLRDLEVGNISEPFITPMGVMLIKLEKINTDYHEEMLSADFKQILLSIDRFLPEDQDIMMLIDETSMNADIEILDISLAKDTPDFYLWNAPEDVDPQELYDELMEKDDPETHWRDLPGDTVILRINDESITAGELDEISSALMPSQREIYNIVINKYFRDNLAMKGYFKEYHDDIISKLNDIKSQIEAGTISFELAQEEYTDDPGSIENPVYEGVEKGMFAPEFEEIMFEIPLNTISEPFFTQFGGHILEVVDEELDDDGERVSVDVRHILVSFENYVDQDDPNAMYQVRLKLQNETEIKVYDAHIHSLLPNLGKSPEQMAAEQVIMPE